MDTGEEELCLPCSDGQVNCIRLSEHSLYYTSGQFAVMYGNGHGGFGWREQPEYGVASTRVALPSNCNSLHLLQRASPTLVRNPALMRTP
eukprot:144767-Prymnesium_polylepis.1